MVNSRDAPRVLDCLSKYISELCFNKLFGHQLFDI